MLVSVVGRGSGTNLPWWWTVNCIINPQDLGCLIVSNLPTSNKVFVIPNRCLQCCCGPLWTLETTMPAALVCMFPAVVAPVHNNSRDWIDGSVLTALKALTEDPGQFPALTTDGSQPSVTLVPGEDTL